jgi:hypothetical protein
MFGLQSVSFGISRLIEYLQMMLKLTLSVHKFQCLAVKYDAIIETLHQKLSVLMQFINIYTAIAGNVDKYKYDGHADPSD